MNFRLYFDWDNSLHCKPLESCLEVRAHRSACSIVNRARQVVGRQYNQGVPSVFRADIRFVYRKHTPFVSKGYIAIASLLGSRFLTRSAAECGHCYSFLLAILGLAELAEFLQLFLSHWLGIVRYHEQ